MINQNKILQAFDIYAALAAKGEISRSDAAAIWEDEDIRLLVENFAQHVRCTIIDDSVNYYLIPLALESPFHISNDTFKRKYLPAKAVNLDMYLLYLAVIVLFGCFYDSYQTNKPVEFVTMSRWLEEMDQHIEALNRHDEAVLQAREREDNYNWLALIHKWQDMDSIKETAHKQDGRTSSRLSFLNRARDFLITEGLLRDIGAQQVELTEKAQIIITSYYMNSEYNRGIMNFMYDLDHKEDTEKEGKNHASYQ